MKAWLTLDLVFVSSLLVRYPQISGVALSLESLASQSVWGGEGCCKWMITVIRYFS